MLTQEDIQRERLESIEKGRMDYRSEKKAAHAEGYAEGYAEGFAEGLAIVPLIGQIQILQALLREDQTPVDDLDALSEDSLKEMCSRLYESARQAGFPVSRSLFPTVSSEPS